jgi:hypothetical protein
MTETIPLPLGETTVQEPRQALPGKLTAPARADATRI